MLPLKKLTAAVVPVLVLCLAISYSRTSSARETLSPDATFSNPQSITINSGSGITPATPYGSKITVSGQSGVISHLSVTLNGFSHTFPRDVDILLVNPSGKALVLMSDVGGNSVSGATITFDDSAASTMPDTVAAGTYRPTDNTEGTPDNFPAPAPEPPYAQFNSPLSTFNGWSPNGDWLLFVVDDSPGNAGSISGGWSLNITTAPYAKPAAPSCFAPSFEVTNLGVGVNPTGVAVADLNNDGISDLAVANEVSNNLSIFLGRGGSSFVPQTPVLVASSPYSVVAGRFNGDSNYDLAVVNSASNNISILLGNGDGTFASATNFPVGPDPISAAVGDINNDGFQDIVVANFGGFFSGSVSVLLGNGSGAFITGTTIRTRTQPSFVLLTELNGDTKLDLVVANFGSDSVSTYFGRGDGTFALNQNIATAAGPVAVATADVVGQDGIRDLIVADYNADSITTCMGSAAGSFSACHTDLGNGPNPISLAAADFLGSGFPSFATALNGTNVVKAGPITNVTVGQNPSALATADFNGDGKPDIVSANSGSNDISILLNNCRVAVGNLLDFGGRRRTDTAVFRPSNSTWWVPSLASANPAIIFGRSTDKLVPADYDGDHLADFAYYRPEKGTWFAVDRNSRPIHFLQFGLPGDIPVPADYDGDGRADIAVWRPSDGVWYIRRSLDYNVQFIPWGMEGDKPVPGDYDGDGRDDVAVYRPSEGVWYIQKSSDRQLIARQFGIAEDKTVQGDYDGDGKTDIAVWRPSTGVWYVLRSSDGDFRAFAFGAATDIPLIGDFDGDGKYDYAVWRPSEGNWYIWKSSDNSATVLQWGTLGDVPIPSVYVR